MNRPKAPSYAPSHLARLVAIIVAAFALTLMSVGIASAQTLVGTPYGTVPGAGGAALGASPGEVYAVDNTTGNVYRVAPGGAPTSLYGQGRGSVSRDVERTPVGDLIVVREAAPNVLRYAAGCTTPCTATVLFSGVNFAFSTLDGAGNLYAASYTGGQIHRFASNCTAPCTSTIVAIGVAGPAGMVVDAAGDLLVVLDSGSILKFAAGCAAPCTGSAYASLNGVASGARGMVAGPGGSLYVVLLNRRLYSVPAGGGTGSGVLLGTVSTGQVGFGLERDPVSGQLYMAGNTSSSGLYTIAFPPAVTAVSPSSGPLAGGTVITLTGTGFTSPGSSNTVRFGSTFAAGTPATSVTYVSATELTVTAPAGQVGVTNVFVSNANGTSVDAGASDNFIYQTVAPVPTMSEWAMILLGVLMAGSAVVMVQRRRMMA